eukprot:TRINITY_DN244_c0_g2_i1.p1 TRINITY_DN244_c0_g2~~TRINITY_DN244_c0_g2_i1.p1  ORF type:complete len:549 (+),score=125.31 TRINITY_DN244_c0_g2_i1:198-1844(+)
MHKYRLISKKGEGTFSEVLKAQSIKSGKHVAIKCMKNHFDSIDQVNNLREIQALRRLVGHPNIIRLYEVLYDEPTGRLALVFELMDMNLYEAIKGRRHYLPDQKVKHYMYETLKAVDHMHRNGIFHRDVKPENLLIEGDVIKLADLGSCRGIYSRQPFTEYISTRWYRAPECLLTDGYYNFKMDLFAVGAVCFEIVALFPLFPGKDEMDQIQKIHNVLGTPPPELLARKFKRNASHMDFDFPEKKGTGLERLIPHADPELVDLIKRLIKYDPDERILARQALKDSFFRDLRDAEKEAQQQQQASVHTTAAPMQSQVMPKAAMSASSSASGMEDHNNPEVTNNHDPTVDPTHDEEQSRTGGLPTIRQKAAEKFSSKAAAASSAGGGGGTSVSGVESGDDATESGEGTVLPPIGGLKGKRDSKSKVLKSVGNATLQKSTIPSSTVHGTMSSSHASGSHGPRTLGVLGTSKGFSGTLGGASATGSSTDPMSSTNPHSWGGAKDTEHRRTASPGSAPITDKMNSTWAPNQGHQPRRYISPFGAKLAPVGKKR